MHDLLENQEFQRLEKVYPFLSHAREEFSSLDKEKYCIIDIETTGLDYTKNEIIEIAAIKLKNGEVENIFDTLVKPKGSISPEIEKLTGINDDMVQDHEGIEIVGPKFLDFIGNDILVAHNSSFDVPFLMHHIGKKFENQVVCTVKASRYLLPALANHKLHTVAAHFNVTAQNRHRALGDVETTLQVWLKMIPMLREKGIYKKEDLHKIPS